MQETRIAVEAGARAPEESEAAIEALSRLYLLRDFLDRELSTHIAKEERALFQALRRLFEASDELVYDMLSEHEMIREKQRMVGQALDGLTDDHEAVDRARLSLSINLGIAAADGLREALSALLETVVQLDWILRGHFTGEEDGLFLPAAELLPASALAMVAEQMTAIAGAAELS